MEETIVFEKGVFPQVQMENEEAKEKILVLFKEKRARMERKPRSEMTVNDVLLRWPCVCAHIICESLGYATPTMAACILYDAANGNENHCEWITCCSNSDPKPAVKTAIATRHYHRGYMADYKSALHLVIAKIILDYEPTFASWF
jgi:hypothetical protein